MLLWAAGAVSLLLIIDSGCTWHVHHRESDLINRRPCLDLIAGVDGVDVPARVIGDLPMMARDVKGRSRHFLLRNVRCVPQFGCTLVSVDQLWAESGTDCVFRDTRLLVPKSGPAIPFTHRDGLYILEAAVVTHSLAASDTPGAPARVRSLVCRSHSSKSSSHS